MAKKIIRGGANQAEFWSITANAFATKQFTLDATVKTDLVLNDDGTWTLTWDNKHDDEDLYTFLATYGPVVGASTDADEEYTYEDSTIEAADAASTGQTACGCIVYGNPSTGDSATGKRKCFIGYGYILTGAGSWSQEAKKSTSPKMEWKSAEPDATTTVNTADWDGALVTGSDQTISTSGGGGKVVFLAVP